MHISEQMFGGNADSLSHTHTHTHTHTHKLSPLHTLTGSLMIFLPHHLNMSKHLLWLTALLQHPDYYHSCCLKCVWHGTWIWPQNDDLHMFVSIYESIFTCTSGVPPGYVNSTITRAAVARHLRRHWIKALTTINLPHTCTCRTF